MVQKQQRNGDDPIYVLRQRYLIQLAERIGTLNLVQIDSDGRGIALERVYVPPPAEGYVSFAPGDDWKDGEPPPRDSFQLGVEVQDWHVVDWWIDKMESVWEAFTTYAYDKAPRHHADYWGFEEAPLLAHVAQIEAAIERYRQANPELKPDDEYRSRNKWCNGRHDWVRRLDMADLATLRNRLIILGGPGTGKSTFVRYLALCLAGAQIAGWNRDATLDQLGIWSHGPLTPVYIELQRFVASDQYPTNYAINPSAETLWRYIEAELNASDLAGYAVDLQLDLVQGRAVLILDGLDEVPYDDNKLPDRRRQLRALMADLSQTYSHSRIIATSRPSAYERWELQGFDRIAIGHSQSLMLAKQQHILATQIYQVAGLAPDAAVAKSSAFMSQLAMVDSELIGSPLFMTLLATIFLQSAEGRFPTRGSRLYQQIIRLLLARGMKAPSGIQSLPDIWRNATVDELFERFAALAYDVQDADESNGPESATPEIDKALLIRHLNPDSERIGFDLVNYLNENLAVLVGSSQNAEHDIFRFAHRHFQEYLAAWEIVRRCQQTGPAGSFVLLRKLIQEKPSAWRAPGLLVADVLLDNLVEADLWSLVSDLLGDNLPTNRAADDPHWWSLWLAAAIVDQQRLLMNIPAHPEVQRTCARLRDYILLAESTQALPAAERAMCNKLLLNWLGDLQPITIVGLQSDGLPDIAWCEVPDSDEWLYQNVKYEPIPAFFMATEHVLDAQFQAFVDASDGFNNLLWWNGLHPDGLKQQQVGPNTSPKRFGNYSRTDVSWYDAMAFCGWLSAKMGYEIMLPTELQCKKFYSAFDLAGDIGEWTCTEFGSKDSMTFDNNETRSVVVSRGRTKNVFPEDRDPHISFRVCCRADAHRTYT